MLLTELNYSGTKRGGGSGRKYTAVITATDQAGNVATANTEILVPRDYPDSVACLNHWNKGVQQ